MANKSSIEITCPHCGTKQDVIKDQWFGGAVKQCKRCIASIRDELKIHECKTYYTEIDDHQVVVQIRNRRIAYWHLDPKLTEVSYENIKDSDGKLEKVRRHNPPYTEDELKTRIRTQLRRQRIID